jgi:hypothetical protein
MRVPCWFCLRPCTNNQLWKGIIPVCSCGVVITSGRAYMTVLRNNVVCKSQIRCMLHVLGDNVLTPYACEPFLGYCNFTMRSTITKQQESRYTHPVHVRVLRVLSGRMYSYAFNTCTEHYTHSFTDMRPGCNTRSPRISLYLPEYLSGNAYNLHILQNKKH